MAISKKRKKRKKLKSASKRPNTPWSLEKIKDLELLGKEDVNITIDKNLFEDRVSELLYHFGKDFYDEAWTPDDYSERVSIAGKAWNIGLFEVEEREKRIKKIVKRYDHVRGIEGIVRDFVDKKIEDYGEYRYYIASQELTFRSGGRVEITVNSVLVE